MQSVIRLSRLYRFRLYRPRFSTYARMLGLFFSTAGLLLMAQAQTAQAQAQPEPTDPVADVTIPDLRGANEAQVRVAWEKLQDQLRITEATLPAAVIPLYGQFLDQGGARYGGVAIEVVAHVGKLYLVDLRDFDKAIEAYDWGLANYAQHPDAIRLQSERLEALKAQAQQEQGKEGLKIADGGVTLPNLGATVPKAVIPMVPGMVAGVVSPEPVRAERAAAVGTLNFPALGVDPATTAVPFGKAASSPLAVAPVAFTPPSLVPAPRPGNYLGWRAGPDRCVTALARQKNGRLWVATEDSGVWCCDESAPALTRWKQFRSGDGLGDDSAYALAVDQQDRVWVGTLNHGVSVWNGKSWKNYGVLDGPLGERVFDIAVCPTDGDVWIATNAGLTRYSQSLDAWSYITRAEGLPSDQVQALAFDKAGNLIVGTQCDGIALAQAAEGYKTWKVLAGPDKVPTTATGQGLPSSLINDVLVSKDGTIYVATVSGLSWSKDKGASWSYVRGKDYAAKVKGLYGGAPNGWSQEPRAVLAEDYISCLNENEKGQLLLGYWQQGNGVVETQEKPSIGVKNVLDAESRGVVKAILSIDNEQPLLARYDEGISKSSLQPARTSLNKFGGTPTNGEVATSTDTKFPSSATLPSLQELSRLLKQVESVPTKIQEQPASTFAALPLNDDWTTQGDWIDRYGNFACVLSNMGGGGSDLINGYRASWFESRAWIGRNRTEDDCLRYWVQSIRTDNSRSLQHPNLGGRKQTEWDDHGETYPMEKDGPHIYVTIKVPKGQYILSCYFFNKDGKTGNNRLRDYLVEVKSTPMEYSLFNDLGTRNQNAEALFERSALAARARVHDFSGGVYKRFYINVPEEDYFTVRLKRNNSYNTIISGIFLDPVGELCGPQGPVEQPAQTWQQRFTDVDKVPKSEAEACMRLMDRLLYLRDANSSWYATQSRNYLLPLLRALLKKEGDSNLAQQLEKESAGENLRHNVAACLNDVQMFDLRDRIYFNPKSYQSYVWDELSALGQKSDWQFESYLNAWKWNDDNLRAFIAKQQAKQSWQ